MFWSQIDDLHLWSLVAEDGYLFRAVIAQYCFLQTYFFLVISISTRTDMFRVLGGMQDRRSGVVCLMGLNPAALLTPQKQHIVESPPPPPTDDVQMRHEFRESLVPECRCSVDHRTHPAKVKKR